VEPGFSPKEVCVVFILVCDLYQYKGWGADKSLAL
jgi:hypothetical protein